MAEPGEHQVRRYTSWSRWVSRTPSSPSRAAEHAHRPGPGELIPLTSDGDPALFIALVVDPSTMPPTGSVTSPPGPVSGRPPP
ncbi:hypothetical protein ABT373_20815 [Streptomyces sp. NPDC000070]|uniref:hypothetical protein n=1 Tax=Streptomyces sp. NPDC000070 TaxID=3154240 RepID=UPI003323A1A9